MPVVTNPTFQTATVSIASGSVHSSALDFSKWVGLAVYIPASGVDGAKLRVTGSTSLDGTYVPLTLDGSAMGGTFVAGSWYVINTYIALPYLKFHFEDVSNVDVSQSAAVSLTVSLKS